jgi:hypothetical protein
MSQNKLDIGESISIANIYNTLNKNRWCYWYKKCYINTKVW